MVLKKKKKKIVMDDPNSDYVIRGPGVYACVLSFPDDKFDISEL